VRHSDANVLLFLLAGATRLFFRRCCWGCHGLLGHLLLASDRFCRPLARTRVGVGALAAHRETPAMTKTAIAAKVQEALDVHRHFAAQIAFDEVVAVDGFADLNDLRFRQVMDAA
jgi:hypothetical protein